GGERRCRLPGDDQRPTLRLHPRARGGGRRGMVRARRKGRGTLGPDRRAGGGDGLQLRCACRRPQPCPRDGERRHRERDPRGSGREEVLTRPKESPCDRPLAPGTHRGAKGMCTARRRTSRRRGEEESTPWRNPKKGRAVSCPTVIRRTPCTIGSTS